MKISGKPLLWIDRLFWPSHRLADFILDHFGKTDPKPEERILIIKFLGLGSIIRLSSLLKRNGVDKGKITLITLEPNRELCKLIQFDNVHFIQTKNILLFLKDCFKILLSVKSENFSLIIDYERCSHSVGLFRIVLGFLARCKTISFESERTVQTTRQIIFPIEEFNQEELFLKGITFMPRTNSLPSVEEMIQIEPLKILVNINASNYLLARRYPVDCFAEIIRSLNEWNSSYTFYLTGSAAEIKYVTELEQKLQGLPVINVAGKWSLDTLRHELASCALFITCDSGPLQLAITEGVSTIALWGPTQPEHFGYGTIRHLHNISLNLPCSPCFRHPASNPAVACNGRIDCLTKLPSSLIIAKAKSILTLTETSRPVNASEIFERNSITEFSIT